MSRFLLYPFKFLAPFTKRWKITSRVNDISFSMNPEQEIRVNHHDR